MLVQLPSQQRKKVTQFSDNINGKHTRYFSIFDQRILNSTSPSLALPSFFEEIVRGKKLTVFFYSCCFKRCWTPAQTDSDQRTANLIVILKGNMSNIHLLKKNKQQFSLMGINFHCLHLLMRPLSIRHYRFCFAVIFILLFSGRVTQISSEMEIFTASTDGGQNTE